MIIKVYSYVVSLYTIVQLIDEILKYQICATIDEATEYVERNIMQPKLEEFEAVHYEEIKVGGNVEKRVFCRYPNSVVNETTWFALPTNWVGINKKKFYKNGDKQYQSQKDLSAYFKENLTPPPPVRIGKDLPSVKDVEVLRVIEGENYEKGLLDTLEKVKKVSKN